jgi:PqqD family protein of HPr-rel-A system
MPNSGRVVWKVSEGSTLLWKSWDEHILVFNAGSGNTHLLDPIAGEVLRHLDNRPAHTEELAQRVAVALYIPISPDLECYIERLLPDLDQAGLIDPVHG